MTPHALHIAHHAPDCDDLLLDAVRPVLESVPGGYFLRHWQRGPHLRVITPEPVPDDDVRRLADHLAAHPSTTVLDQDALLPAHRRLAAAEQVSGPLTPFYPDNTVRRADHDDRSAVLGAAADLVTAAHVATTPVLFDVLTDVRAGGSRLGIALDLVLATAHAYAEGGIAGGFVSFRSHAEAFLADGDREAVRRRWDGEYARRREALRDRLDAVTSTVDCEAAVPHVRRWLAALDPVRDRAGELLATGELAFDRVRGAATSEFHRTLDTNERWHAEVAPSVAFGTYRVLLNCAYLQLTRLGIRPVERFALCHLAANAVEEREGVRALDLVRDDPTPVNHLATNDLGGRP
ncbi:hypothetical protein GCM10022243_30270 [Saccharothrix violaceirubra]|uniref:Thiopeptide-type bacteriocin biosynthesis domain-containing protein n=1 Tax=Saccharothrix violaceirubra TaxID=413306 RepID=A0A7W7T507_9PSEU|nr:thiopeptide maturation pyridine synthase [Saccharothrix violaceirubra]MBB4966652.1 hypothetical protein [Saccharothrix violaceirubra]